MHSSLLRQFYDRSVALYFLDLGRTQIISFPPFFLYISAAPAGHKNGVEGHTGGAKKLYE